MHKNVKKKALLSAPALDKLFYKIGEVSKITGVEPYVLRYWETEFPFLRPRKNKSGQRVYVKKDLELIFQLKRMLYDERYTIEGVRKKFGDLSHRINEKSPTSEVIPIKKTGLSQKDIVDLVKNRLESILRSLK